MTNSVVIIRNVPTASTGTTIGSRCVPVLEVAVSRVLVGAFIERSRFEWGGVAFARRARRSARELPLWSSGQQWEGSPGGWRGRVQ